VIGLMVGGEQCDSLKIAVNAYTTTTIAAIWCCTCNLTWCINNQIRNCEWYSICNGEPWDPTACGGYCGNEMACCTPGDPISVQYTSWETCAGLGNFEGWNDNRTAEEEAAGCCPYQLL